jgi:RNA polymerase sigma factor (sigma-70 family)
MNSKKKTIKYFGVIKGNPEGPWAKYTCRDLIQLFRNGTKEAFTGLYDRYIGLVFTICYRRVSNLHIAEELANSTYTRALVRLHQFKMEQKDTSFKKWIGRIAISVSYSFLRHKKVEVEAFEGPIREEYGHPEAMPSHRDPLLEKENTHNILQAIASLPELTRYCIEGFYLHDLKYEDLMNIYSLNKDQVAFHLKYGRRLLKQKLKNWFD